MLIKRDLNKELTLYIFKSKAKLNNIKEIMLTPHHEDLQWLELKIKSQIQFTKSYRNIFVFTNPKLYYAHTEKCIKF